jgi:hypothetical protein
MTSSSTYCVVTLTGLVPSLLDTIMLVFAQIVDVSEPKITLVVTNIGTWLRKARIVRAIRQLCEDGGEGSGRNQRREGGCELHV